MKELLSGIARKSDWEPLPSPTFFPFPSPLPSLPLPLEVGPILQLGCLGERLSSPSRSTEPGPGPQSPAEPGRQMVFGAF